MPTHYETLGVAPTASQDQIRRAYLEAARRHHPDKHIGSTSDQLERARARMAEVNAAWAVLSDTGRRRAYDDLIGSPAAERPSPDQEWHERPAWAAEPDTDDAPPELSAQSVVFVPVALLVAAGATLAFAMMSQIAALLGVAFVLAAVAAFGFVAAPLLTMRRRRDRGTRRVPRS